MKDIDRKIKILKERDEINILNELRIKGNIKQLKETGNFHPTAKLTNKFLVNDTETKILKDILLTDFTEQHDWMCAPIFREAIVFYNKNEDIVSVLNVCLSCDALADEKGQRIQTDFTVFP